MVNSSGHQTYSMCGHFPITLCSKMNVHQCWVYLQCFRFFFSISSRNFTKFQNQGKWHSQILKNTIDAAFNFFSDKKILHTFKVSSFKILELGVFTNSGGMSLIKGRSQIQIQALLCIGKFVPTCFF